MQIRKILQEHYTTIAIILAIIVTAILYFVDCFNHEQVGGFTLIAVGGLAVSMIFTALTSEKNFHNAIDCLEHRISSQKVTRKEHYKLLNRAISNAKKQIWIMTIDSALSSSTVSTIPERTEYYKALKKIIKSNKNITVRRIYGLPTDTQARQNKITWINSDITELKDCPNFQARVFDWNKFDNTLSPFSLQIVDDIFMGIVNTQHTTGIEGGGEDICIEDKNVVQYFNKYYEEVWQKCNMLKTGNDIIYTVLN
ncbi:MAG: hypothetical protein LBN95_08655 [Prevotellaceae bacterium]|jgi:hypothetical protein|nr:hypothetical protein [Prevotellaceae bacterium]